MTLFSRKKGCIEQGIALQALEELLSFRYVDLYMISTNSSLAFLEQIGTVDDIRAKAIRTDSDQLLCAVNAHIHLPPNFSAFESVEQAVEQAVTQHVHVLGASNYYDYQVYRTFAQAAIAKGIFPIFGIEILSMIDDLREREIKINDPGNPGKIYFCGKAITAFDPISEVATPTLETLRKQDKARIAAMIDKLAQVAAERNVNLPISESIVIDRVVKRHGCPRETVYLQERHVALAAQEILFEQYDVLQQPDALAKLLGLDSPVKDLEPVQLQNDIRSKLLKAGKPAFVQESYISFEQAFDLVLGLGGIPCYPVLLDGTSPVNEFEQTPEQLVEHLQSRNVHAVEFIANRNSPEILTHYAQVLDDAGFIVTAGTEHNTLDLLPIEPVCEEAEIPDDAKALFWKGTCVLAAHQFLCAQGEHGYVDAKTGEPNRSFDNAKERIAWFSMLGAGVLSGFLESHLVTHEK